jgi:tetratricopeptide (TPR) repeat protein
MNHSSRRAAQAQVVSMVGGDPWYWQGVTLADAGNYAEALSWFDQGLDVQPRHLKGWVFRCVVLIHLGRYQEALESSDRALEIQPNDAEAWTFRGVALHRLSRYREAYESYDRALGQRRAYGWQRLLRWLPWIKSSASTNR